MPDAILTVNAGSSSIKFSLFKIDPPELQLAAIGKIEEITTAPHMSVRNGAGEMLADRRWPIGGSTTQPQTTHEDFLDDLLRWIDDHLAGDRLIAAGHRVVHGGAQFGAPLRVGLEDIAAIERLAPLAPLHQPHNVAAIKAIFEVRPGLPQVACFDTAFHRGHRPVVDRFGLPREMEQRFGIRRYGFHGISYEYIAGALRDRVPALAPRRIIAAHLGNGASLCAMENGCSVDTTMGFATLDGLVMGTRCGALDAGVVLFFEHELGMTPDEVQDLLYNRSGLLGVSGISSDMRTLLASDDLRAAEAVELFVFRIAREIGALTTTLGGLDGIVFTAGIGEHAPEIRSRVCERIAFMGVALDHEANLRGAACISTDASRVQVWVIPTDEELMIAQHTLSLIQPASRRP